MPDTGKTGLSEEAGTRADAVAILAEADQHQTPLFAPCPTCPGLGRTPTFHVTSCAAGQAPGGKDTGLDGDVEHKRMNADASSTTLPAELHEDPTSMRRCNYPHCQRQSSLEASEKGAVTVVDGSLDQVVARPNTAALGGKRKAEADAADMPASPSKKTQKPDTREADKVKASEEYWENKDINLYSDMKDQLGIDSRGRGNCTEMQLEALSRPNLVENVNDVVEVQSSSSNKPQFVTICCPGFELDTANLSGRMLTSFTDEHYEPDPEGIGLEGLSIFQDLANADET